jgi:adenylate cyclase
MPQHRFQRPPLSAFEQEFSQEIMRIERKRVTILAMVMGFTLLINLIGHLILAGPDARANALVFWLSAGLAAGCIYELVARAIFGHFLRANHAPPLFARYGNVLVETSLPTGFLLIMANYIGLEATLQSNLALFYIIFIVLATLRLNFGLCLWTGVVAAVEYTAVWAILIATHPPADQLFLPSQIAMSASLLLLGSVAGVVAVIIRQRVTGTLRTVEERNRIVSLFGQHVSPLVVDKLLNQQGDTISEARYVCMMFLDIRNFTTFSEHTEPEDVIGYLNTLFSALIEIVNRNHGVINKFLGDGFMAVFGAPLSDGRDSQNAVAAAQEILAEVERLVGDGVIPPTRIGIGLHAGQAITGHVGSALRKEYTVIGDVVNVAARIEQLNKQFGSQLLISDVVWEALDGARPAGEALEPLTVRGRSAPVAIWRLA